MNNISFIEKKISEANQVKERYQITLANDPTNFAFQLSLKSIETHISDLLTKLKIAKEEREFEVLELRLNGPNIKFGSIPLHILGELSNLISSALHSASLRLKKGERSKGKIPQDIIDTLDLRLAGVLSGSTRLLITGKTSPDIFGYSLLENTLENTFKLLNSETSDDMSDSIAELGNRSTNKLNKLFKKVSSSDLEVTFKWQSPDEKQYQWSADKERILSLSNSIDKIENKEPEYIEFEGQLVTASLKGFFEIKDIHDIIYKGKLPHDMIDQIQKLHIGQNITGKIKKEVQINMLSDIEKVYYSLVAIDKIL